MLKAITRGIQVQVELFYRPDRSNAHFREHFFEYQISITNKSTSTVQLLNRRWEILESPSIIRVIEGEGVLGDQPTLAPHHSHSYSSFSVINDTIGYMKGRYTFENSNTGEQFQVLIPPMNLIIPAKLN